MEGKKIVLLVLLVFCAGCYGCEDVWDDFSVPEHLTPLETYNTYSEPQIANADTSMTTGTTVGVTGNVITDLSDAGLPRPANSIVYLYRTNPPNNRYGKMIITNDLAVLGPPDYIADLVISWVTYNNDGTVYCTGNNVTIRRTYLCDLDGTGETAVGTDADFQWNMYDYSNRYFQAWNGAVFYLVQ